MGPRNGSSGKDPFDICFGINFDQIWKGMLPEFTQRQHDFRDQTANENTYFDSAGASGSRVGPCRTLQKITKKRKQTIDGPVFGYFSAMLDLTSF